MRAELDTLGSKPVLRLEQSAGSRQAVFDLQLTPEQAKSISIHTEVAR